MAKVKKPAASKRPKEYNDKLPVNGSFLNIMKAAANHANSKSEVNASQKRSKPMKTMYLIGILLGLLSNAQSQTYMILDWVPHKKVFLIDTVKRQELINGQFPIYKAEFDSLVTFMDKFSDIKRDGINRKFYNPDEFKSAHLSFEIENIKQPYGDAYDINLISTGSWGRIILKITDSKYSLITNQHNINRLNAYLRNRKKEADKGDFQTIK